jgi:hypothetical protein
MIDPFNSKPRPAGQPDRPQAKKRAWPPWRLIATLPELEIALTHSKIRPVTFSNRNKKDVAEAYQTPDQNAPSVARRPSTPNSIREPEK